MKLRNFLKTTLFSLIINSVTGIILADNPIISHNSPMILMLWCGMGECMSTAPVMIIITMPTIY
jgi:hypothetical protein